MEDRFVSQIYFSVLWEIEKRLPEKYLSIGKNSNNSRRKVVDCPKASEQHRIIIGNWHWTSACLCEHKSDKTSRENTEEKRSDVSANIRGVSVSSNALRKQTKFEINFRIGIKIKTNITIIPTNSGFLGSWNRNHLSRGGHWMLSRIIFFFLSFAFVFREGTSVCFSLLYRCGPPTSVLHFTCVCYSTTLTIDILHDRENIFKKKKNKKNWEFWFAKMSMTE